jgi:hypothetical protein
MRVRMTILFLFFAFISKGQQTPGGKVNNTSNGPAYFLSINERDSVSKVQWNVQEAHYIEGRRVFKVAEKMPEFPGGNEKMMDYMLKNIKINADDDFVSEIKLTFVVDTNGVCKNIGIIKKGENITLNKTEMSAIKTVQKMPVWKPGVSQGVIVPVQYYLPLEF